MDRKKTLYLTQLALLIAVELVLSFTPLGFIPLPTMKATTLHIPVMLGAILLGPTAGGILGGVMGIGSVINNTITPGVTSFVFSPFYSVGEFHGNLWSLVVAILPRVLIGVVAGWLYRALTHKNKKSVVALAVTGLAGSMTNTVGVMGLIYLLFGRNYAAATGKPYELLFGAIMLVVGTNGVVEAIVAAILVSLIAKPLLMLRERRLGPGENV